MNEEEYEQGRSLWFEDFELRAKVAYLPHTDVVMSFQYLSGLDEQSGDLFPPSAGLPDDWESFAIQINDKVYLLPTPLTAFFGRRMDDSREGYRTVAVRSGRADEEYDRQGIRLTNAQKQSIDVTVYNTTE